jgi:hypothetical protein
MRLNTVDLNDHLNRGIQKGNPADFKVELKPLAYRATPGVPGDRDTYTYEDVPNRLAVVRTDTGEAIAVVSDKYTVVQHQDILDGVSKAIRGLDVGEVPSGVYVDRQGARMRALFKFPELSQTLVWKTNPDRLCPVVKIENTYDGSSRVSIHIGAFRFVCTNLSVGGGGAFAGGFMSVHVGEINVDDVMEQLSLYLSHFDSIVELYRSWSTYQLIPTSGSIDMALTSLPPTHAEEIKIRVNFGATVFDAYNVATDYATHKTRTARVAFELLGQINAGFQRVFGG